MAPRAGVFAANPLSLSVPEPEFESWLRETGYLEVLDERNDFSTPVSSAPASSSSSSAPGKIRRGSNLSALISVIRTLISILTVNPFAKLAAEDFSGNTPPWTAGFLTSASKSGSYSWPGGPSIARLRIQENVRRYARNYASLWLIIFACTLYKMPLTLLGVLTSLAIWEILWFASDSWDPQQRYPGIRFLLVRIAQIATVSILYYCHIQVAIFCAISVSYAVMVLHASLRKLSSQSKPSKGAIKVKRYHDT